MASSVGRSTSPRPLVTPNVSQDAAAAKPALKVVGSAVQAPSRANWAPPLQGEWSVDKKGNKSDPVNLYLHGSLDQVKQALTQAGWTKARPKTVVNNLRFGLFAIPGAIERGAVKLFNKLTGKHVQLNDSDPLYHEVNQEPVDDLLFDGKTQVVAFEKDANPLGGRHHLRVFDTGRVDEKGQPVWAVAASRDTGLKIDLHRYKTMFLNHVVEPNADHERDVLMRDLRAGGAVQSVQTQVASWSPRNPSQLHSEDGKVYDVQL
jgi:hypothetical protein